MRQTLLFMECKPKVAVFSVFFFYKIKHESCPPKIVESVLVYSPKLSLTTHKESCHISALYMYVKYNKKERIS